MATLRQRISLIVVILSVVICFTISFIMGISSVKVFHRRSNSIFKSMNDTQRVTYEITFSSDKEVFPLFPTLLNSIYSNLEADESANIHILTMPDVTPEDYLKLSGLAKRLGFSRKLTLNYYPFKYKLKYKQTLKHVSEATMCRLLLPEILDSEIDRILYIDTDAIVNHSLRELFKIELKSRCGIAGRSSTNSNIINDWLRKDGLISEIEYKAAKSFNAGVLLLSLNKLRENNFVNNTLSLVQKWGINDQIALNFYCNGTYDELPADYNFWAARDSWKDSARHKIVHFAGPNKPWKDNYQPYEEQLLWYKYFLSYPSGEKRTPPSRPTYLLLLKISNGSESDDLFIPEAILRSENCRFMIHIVGINYEGRSRSLLEKKAQRYSKKFWVTYSFLNGVVENKNPGVTGAFNQFVLTKLSKVFQDYVRDTFLALNNFPEYDTFCTLSREPGNPNQTTEGVKKKLLNNVCFEVSKGLYYFDLEGLKAQEGNLESRLKAEQTGFSREKVLAEIICSREKEAMNRSDENNDNNSDQEDDYRDEDSSDVEIEEKYEKAEELYSSDSKEIGEEEKNSIGIETRLFF
ncbi:secreted lipopolysaccharide sugar transferase like family 8 glycosyltransferase [Cryptosporidium felis]|nr:secreted lipopolysaccharide sugar transferase like family 8 glycosyltransferase [Cryptosporidium felis]